EVEYDWKSIYYGKCLKIGHDCSNPSKMAHIESKGKKVVKRVFKLKEPVHETNAGEEQWTKGKNQIAQLMKLLYTEFIYAIWIERNIRRFENREQQHDQLARKITCTISLRASGSVKLVLDR
ncbi:hypothetical protein HAX54_042774, partial [Datura stramonium]|nr:hypothetical protein [Datura stramonium]